MMFSDGVHRKRSSDDRDIPQSPSPQSTTTSNSDSASSLSIDHPILNDKADDLAGAFETLKVATGKDGPEINSSRRRFEFLNLLKKIDDNPVGTASAQVLYVLCKTEAEYKVKFGIPLTTKQIFECKRAAKFAGKDGAIFDELFRKSYVKECSERSRGSTSSSVGNDDGYVHGSEINARSLPIHPLSFIGRALTDQMNPIEKEDQKPKKDESTN
ncbi:Oidioi.mRNA.OKI2018_I69.PAR.g13022.t1.cds [Oikopleura dioica]|uniref:Oidioi.mRNA.OKI2018_I69.PAR.g13022.t1.cds n=1 Tax=Oikopleura dioica TaxID=34765 RepID=A0ABN7S5Z6_OIKDI|nr:Oidioi.mRNA.OKI2018_I69.PAR.g13022.t1.cds [Oikopleura dioica]